MYASHPVIGVSVMLSYPALSLNIYIIIYIRAGCIKWKCSHFS